MQEPVRLYNVTSGINNKVDKSSAAWSNDLVDLVFASNVRVTDAGKLETLPGPTSVSGLNFHSVYQDESIIMVCDTLGDIYSVSANDTLVKIGQNLDGTEVRFQKFGDKVFMQTDSDKLYWDGSQFSAWGFSANLDKELDVQLEGPPSGQLLSKFKDRLIVCKSEAAFMSQSLNPFAFNLMDYVSLNNPITFCHEFDDELLIGSATELVAVRNANTEPSFTRLLPFGAFHGTAKLMWLPELYKCLVLLTTDGVYAYNTQSLMTKLTPRYKFPSMTEASALVIPGTNYYYIVGG